MHLWHGGFSFILGGEERDDKGICQKSAVYTQSQGGFVGSHSAQLCAEP